MEKGKLLVLCLCFCNLSVMLGSMLWCYRHLSKDDSVSSEWVKGWKKYFYPVAYYIYKIWRKKLQIAYPEEKINRLQKLYVGKNRKWLERIYDCQRIILIWIILILVQGMMLCAILGQSGKNLLKEQYYLERGEPGEGSRQVTLQVETEKEKKEVSIEVKERRYGEKEINEKFAEARTYVKEHYLGENISSKEIQQPLNLVQNIPESPISVRWKLDEEGYVNEDGSLNQMEIQREQEICITAILCYGDRQEKMELEGVIFPKKRSQKEKFWEDWSKALEEWEEKTAEKKVLALPKSINHTKLTYRENDQSVWNQILLLGILLCLILPFLLDYQTEQKIAKREQQLQREYPQIVERLILLIGAGLTVRGAWYRITEDYMQRYDRNEIKEDFLYEEMLVTRRELDNGKGEAAAYASFGKRLSVVPYMRLSTLLAQNLKKGSDDLLGRMELEAADAFRERRDTAKKLGEEASTKLIFPMMLMLVIVFAMILIAAFYSL